MQPFGLIGIGRSGSTSLVSFLDSQENCRCYDEIFHHEGRENPLKYLMHKYREAEEEYVGSKLLVAYLEHQQILDICHIPKFRSVFMYRKSIFNGTVSGYLAAKAHNWGDYKKHIRDSFVVDIKEFRSLYKLRKEMTRSVLDLHAEVGGFLVEYMELREEEKLRSLLDFLGLDSKKSICFPGRKIADHSIYEKVLNMSDLEEEFGEKYLCG